MIKRKKWIVQPINSISYIRKFIYDNIENDKQNLINYLNSLPVSKYTLKNIDMVLETNSNKYKIKYKFTKKI
jgi:hypothetical protein